MTYRPKTRYKVVPSPQKLLRADGGCRELFVGDEFVPALTVENVKSGLRYHVVREGALLAFVQEVNGVRYKLTEISEDLFKCVWDEMHPEQPTVGMRMQWGADVSRNLACHSCSNRGKCSEYRGQFPSFYCVRCGRIEVVPSFVIHTDEVPAECPWLKQWYSMAQYCGVCAREEEWVQHEDGKSLLIKRCTHEPRPRLYRPYDNCQHFTEDAPGPPTPASRYHRWWQKHIDGRAAETGRLRSDRPNESAKPEEK